MKKILIVAALLICAAFANLKADTFGKQNYAGINPFGLVFGMYSGEYGRFLDAKGAAEINVPFVFWKYEDYMYVGLGAKYRMYKDKNGEGVFYGGGIYATSWSWDYKWPDSNSQWKDETASWFTVTPMAEAGYRWSWANGWTVAPSLELGYRIATADDKYNGITVDDSYLSGFSWGLNVGLAYMF